MGNMIEQTWTTVPNTNNCKLALGILQPNGAVHQVIAVIERRAYDQYRYFLAASNSSADYDVAGTVKTFGEAVEIINHNLKV